MQITSKYKRLPIILGILLLMAFSATAQERPLTSGRSDGRPVFAEMLDSYRNLTDYIVKIRAKIEMPTMRIPDFSATLYYKKPNKFHIETKSFAPIPRNNGLFNPFQFDPDKNEIVFLRTENPDGVAADLYRVEPLGGKSQVRYYSVWVGKSPLRIIRVESFSIRGTKTVVKLSYKELEQGARKWLLPEKVHVHLTFPEGIKAPEGLMAKDNPLSGGMRRLDEMSGEGNITIVYRDWQINTGLDNRMFKP